MAKTILQRLESKYTVNLTTGCWVWHGSVANSLKKWPYGLVNTGKKIQMAHRVSYEYYKGPIADGLHVDHLCRNTLCINPNHLEPVTPKENINRGIRFQSTKTHCPKNHPLSGTNLYQDPKGHRECRICRKTQWENYKERQKLKDKRTLL